MVCPSGVCGFRVDLRSTGSSAVPGHAGRVVRPSRKTRTGQAELPDDMQQFGGAFMQGTLVLSCRPTPSCRSAKSPPNCVFAPPSAWPFSRPFRGHGRVVARASARIPTGRLPARFSGRFQIHSPTDKTKFQHGGRVRNRASRRTFRQSKTFRPKPPPTGRPTKRRVGDDFQVRPNIVRSLVDDHAIWSSIRGAGSEEQKTMEHERAGFQPHDGVPSSRRP